MSIQGSHSLGEQYAARYGKPVVYLDQAGNERSFFGRLWDVLVCGLEYKVVLRAADGGSGIIIYQA